MASHVLLLQSLQTIQAFSWVAAFLAMAWSRCVIVLLRS